LAVKTSQLSPPEKPLKYETSALPVTIKASQPSPDRARLTFFIRCLKMSFFICIHLTLLLVYEL
jgi:hypothetical protein